jgi:predicted nucleotidyltransferase
MGAAHAYRLRNGDAALIRQMQGLFDIEAERQRQFVAELTEAVPEIISVVLFGSEARHEARPGSDTDLLMVVEAHSSELEEAVSERAAELADQHALALSWHIVDHARLHEWDRTDHPLWRNVRSEGVRLYGWPLEALARRWQPGKAD